jgi:hypothetical protein
MEPIDDSKRPSLRAMARGALRNPMLPARQIASASCAPSARAALAALAFTVAALGAACGSAPGGTDPLLPVGLCAVATPSSPPPYPVQFQFRADGATPAFLQKLCLGHDFGVSSCASGFRDRLAEQVIGACDCANPQCTGPLVGGQCPAPEGTMIAPGATVSAPFSGVSTTPEPRGSYACARSHPLPAGRYRVAVDVYDTAADAQAGVNGRVVTRDFELPAPGGVVDVPLAPSATDVCDATPAASVPVCAGAEAHDVPCALDTGLDFAWVGGLALASDASTIASPGTYTLKRTFADGTPPASCMVAIPRCARDARVVTTGDLERALAQPGVAAAFAGTTPVYGSDTRPSDGSVLMLTRPDGRSVALGGACTGCPHPVTPALSTLESALLDLSWQMRGMPACAALRQ